jgi:hypothetical protein
MQGAAGDAELLGGFGSVAAAAFEGLEDRLFRQVFEVEVGIARAAGGIVVVLAAGDGLAEEFFG